MSQFHEEPGRGSTYSTPRWVKIFGIITVVLVLLIVVMLATGLGGKHGPGRHTSSGDAGGYIPPIEQEVQLDGPVGYTPPIEHGVQQS